MEAEESLQSEYAAEILAAIARARICPLTQDLASIRNLSRILNYASANSQSARFIRVSDDYFIKSTAVIHSLQSHSKKHIVCREFSDVSVREVLWCTVIILLAGMVSMWSPENCIDMPVHHYTALINCKIQSFACFRAWFSFIELCLNVICGKIKRILHILELHVSQPCLLVGTWSAYDMSEKELFESA